jgi:hypothetical protein
MDHRNSENNLESLYVTVTTVILFRADLITEVHNLCTLNVCGYKPQNLTPRYVCNCSCSKTFRN